MNASKRQSYSANECVKAGRMSKSAAKNWSRISAERCTIPKREQTEKAEIGNLFSKLSEIGKILPAVGLF